MKDSKVLVALIPAVIAAVISAGVAFWTSQSTVRLEMNKVIASAHQNVLGKIIEARLKVYPYAYALVSQMVKDAPEKRIDYKYLVGLRSKFDRWDSQNAYLLGPDSSNITHTFRQVLLQSIIDAEQGTLNLENLLFHAGKFELALRSDLGIYGLGLEQLTASIRTPKLEKY